MGACRKKAETDPKKVATKGCTEKAAGFREMNTFLFNKEQIQSSEE